MPQKEERLLWRRLAAINLTQIMEIVCVRRLKDIIMGLMGPARPKIKDDCSGEGQTNIRSGRLAASR
jgi:hypothetical protein